MMFPDLIEVVTSRYIPSDVHLQQLTFFLNLFLGAAPMYSLWLLRSLSASSLHGKTSHYTCLSYIPWLQLWISVWKRQRFALQTPKSGNSYLSQTLLYDLLHSIWMISVAVSFSIQLFPHIMHRLADIVLRYHYPITIPWTFAFSI